VILSKIPANRGLRSPSGTLPALHRAMHTRLVHRAALSPLIAAACFSRPKMEEAPVRNLDQHTVDECSAADDIEIRAEAEQEPAARDEDFLKYLERRLGVSAETALATLGETLLSYERQPPSAARKSAISNSAEMPPISLGVSSA
jgi:hypothetical protein